MDLANEIRAAESSPQELENLYQQAQVAGRQGDFQAEISNLHAENPDNLLYAAWYYRLQEAAEPAAKPRRAANWLLALPLSILTGLLFWLLSDFETYTYLGLIPHLALWWAPLATLSALVYLSVTAGSNRVRAVALCLGALAAAGYAMLLAPGLDVVWRREQYLILATIHIPLLCWVALGVSVLGIRSSARDRFAFLIKSIEVIITAGLYLIAGVALGAITVGMFAALSIKLPDPWLRLIVAGGFGLLPVLAIASVYDPTRTPAGQDFDQGLSKFIATMMRLLLPLTLGILVIYIFVIPFNFLEPYNNRDVLIVYNAMLFAIMGLLVGATPIQAGELSPQLQVWLRRGILSVAILAVLISIYALSATIYRTIGGGLTINRLMIIGWNAINIALLLWLVFKQIKAGSQAWVDAMHSVFSLACAVYALWGLLLLLAIPWIFRWSW